MTPKLLLTRPRAQSKALANRFAGSPVLIAPIIEILPTDVDVRPVDYAGVILTSANGAETAPDLDRNRVYCVGKSTAAAARARGAEVASVTRNADELVAAIVKSGEAGPLVHLRGAHARGNIAGRLGEAGIQVDEFVVYDQKALTLMPLARKLIASGEPVVLPLYSPRSATLVGRSTEGIGPRVRVIAMSDAVAEAWRTETGHEAEVVAAPTGAAMEQAIGRACGLTPP